MSQRRITEEEVTRPSEIQAEQTYQLVRYRNQLADPVTQTLNQFPYKVVQVEAMGDHFAIVQINGSLPVYVKLGSPRNPWIRAQERMTIRRNFRRLYFTTGDNTQGATIGPRSSQVELIGYASVGPLLDMTPQVPGIRRGFVTAQITVADTATPAYTDVMQAMRSVPGINAGTRFLSSGVSGGMLVMRNTGSTVVNIFYGGFGLAGTATPNSGAYRMGVAPDPSSVLVLPVNGMLTSVSGGIVTDTILANAPGGGSLDVLLSPQEQDAMIPDMIPHLDINP